MARNSSIEWTHHTFNPWWGCVKVSPACKNCYAETWAKRVGLGLWGASAPRRFFSDAHWNEPIKWNREAQREGERRRVFCASMADVFEARAELNEWRERLWGLIELTPMLDWLLLTKRPERIGRCVPWRERWPHNVWLGTTAENQRWLDKRIPELLRYARAPVLFISAEPLFGFLNMRPYLPARGKIERAIDWVIAGGESGARARPMNPEWARDLRDQCTQAGAKFHFKQWGHWSPEELGVDREHRRQQRIEVYGRDGRPLVLVRLGKKAAGRTLDGATWDEFPEPRAADAVAA
jgi:protein gp37